MFFVAKKICAILKHPQQNLPLIQPNARDSEMNFYKNPNIAMLVDK
jgi:hypothetical protein